MVVYYFYARSECLGLAAALRDRWASGEAAAALEATRDSKLAYAAPRSRTTPLCELSSYSIHS